MSSHPSRGLEAPAATLPGVSAPPRIRPVRALTGLALARLAVALLAAGCGSTGTASTPSASTPGTIAEQLTAADAALRSALGGWRASDPKLANTPPAGVLTAAARERQLVHQLAETPSLIRPTLAALPPSLAAALRSQLRAALALRRLAGPPSGKPVTLHLDPAPPAGQLLADYHLAQSRFGVRWETLAAVNLVESAFGRVASTSSAGAQGPMQFLPATWKAYGLGGDIHSPRDAVLGAGNYLHQSGAPADERRALFAYNHSGLYVRAVQAYAHAMVRDPLGFLTLYAWEASLPATIS
jgi:soluble lytic murein transglycosylase-like protein